MGPWARLGAVFWLILLYARAVGWYRIINTLRPPEIYLLNNNINMDTETNANVISILSV